MRNFLTRSLAVMLPIFSASASQAGVDEFIDPQHGMAATVETQVSMDGSQLVLVAKGLLPNWTAANTLTLELPLPLQQEFYNPTVLKGEYGFIDPQMTEVVTYYMGDKLTLHLAGHPLKYDILIEFKVVKGADGTVSIEWVQVTHSNNELNIPRTKLLFVRR